LAISYVLATGNLMAQQRIAAVDSKTAAAASPADAAKEAASKSAPSLEEMLSTIRRLEERVRELEAKATQAAENANHAAITTAVPAVETAPVKPSVPGVQDAKGEEEKANNGILGFFRSTEITGFVDAYYGYNFNSPPIDTQLRNFDTRHNQFSFNLAEIALEKKPTPESRVGFRTDLNFGPTADIVNSLEPAGSETFRHLQQAYVSYLAPVGNGLQIDAGKFVTQHGAEVIETKDNWNYSRSLMFALAIPYYHFGVRASYPVNDKVSLGGFLVNGWNNVFDNNTSKTVGLQAIIKPTSKFTWIQNYMAGPEQTGNSDDWRQLFDTTVMYTVNDKLSLMANYDYGFDRLSGARVHWQGIAAYAKIQANDWYAFSPRFEWYDDHDGFTTGLPQTVKDITLTSEHKIKGLITRLEYRRDFSDQDFFLKSSNRIVRAQSTLTFGLVYAFTSKGE
jgi:hypothetical protein